MVAQFRPALVLIVMFTILTGLVYPLAITGIAQVALPSRANGSLLTKDGTIVGSSLVGQSFTADKYFHGRPSATSAPDPQDATKTVDAPYNAANSGASNFGATSQKLLDRVKASVAELGGSPDKPVPADAVTTSASGLDPDISRGTALMQVERIAAARKVQPEAVKSLVDRMIERPVIGLFGEERLNVLRLNMALDALGG